MKYEEFFLVQNCSLPAVENPSESAWKHGYGEVDLWWLPTDSGHEHICELAKLLEIHELERAGRFRSESDRRRFILAHGILRILVGRYTKTDPAEIRFRYGRWKKPELALSNSSGKLQFNLSHSGNIVLYAFAFNRQVGVDIEQFRDLPDMDRIAERFFSSGEVAVLRQLSKPLRNKAFFKYWTRKESIVKATGEGFSRSLQSFETHFMIKRQVISLPSEDDGKEIQWILCDLECFPNHAAALAVQQDVTAIKVRKIVLLPQSE